VARHPSEASLALFAGGELGPFRKWRIERHVAACADCGREVSEFSALRSEIAAADGTPELDWKRMAGELRANIRLGLEAGACIEKEVFPIRFSPWTLAACASLVLLVAAILLERPAPRVADAKPQEAAVLEASGMGIQIKEGEQALMLLNPRARGVSVNYSAGGSAMRARYVDPDTHYVTINDVYVQ